MAMAEPSQLQRVWPLHPTSCPQGLLWVGMGRVWALAGVTRPSLLQRCSPIPRRRIGCLLPPPAMTTVSQGPGPSWGGGTRAGVGAPGLGWGHRGWGGGVERFQASGTRLQTSLPSHRTRLSCGPVHLPATRPRCFLLPRVGLLVGAEGLCWRPSQPDTCPSLPVPRGGVPAAAFLPGDHGSDPGPGPQPPGLQEVEEQAGVLEGPQGAQGRRGPRNWAPGFVTVATQPSLTRRGLLRPSWN